MLANARKAETIRDPYSFSYLFLYLIYFYLPLPINPFNFPVKGLFTVFEQTEKRFIAVMLTAWLKRIDFNRF